MSGEAWVTGDWVPNLVKPSICLGALPSTAGVSSFSIALYSQTIFSRFLRSFFGCQ